MSMCKDFKPYIHGNTDTEEFFRNIMAVTNRHLCRIPFPEQIERVCRCHPKALILREKDLTEESYTILAHDIMRICKKYKVDCILHSYPNVAGKLECANIHLPLSLLRQYHTQLGDFSVVGTSVHSIEEAREAESLGASYLTAGHIYLTDCKKGVPARGMGFLRNVCQSVSIPVFAIGGIRRDPAQLAEVMSYGAKGACIMSEMMKL